MSTNQRIPRRGASSAPACSSSKRSSADSCTVRVENLPPTVPIEGECTIRAILRHVRIGGLQQVYTPLDRDRCGRPLVTSSRMRLVFKDGSRAGRAAAALDGYRLGACILSAKQVRPAAPATSTPVVEEVPLASDFPELPEPAPRPPPVAVARPAPWKVEREDACSSVCGTESVVTASDADTECLLCSFCRRPGHRARGPHGVILCAKLMRKEQERRAAEEEVEDEKAQQKIARCLDRAIARKLAQREAEETGWMTVGRVGVGAGANLFADAAVNASGGIANAPIEPAAETEGHEQDGSTRSQRRMQKRREKSRAKRAAAQ